jgi:uncharacterized repeat protein (TIGR01451 family)
LVAFLLSIAMILSIVFVVGVQRAGADSYPPTSMHLTWNENENKTATTIVVTWETESSSSGDNVKYDIVSRGGIPGSYSYSAVGTHHTYPSAGTGWIHDVELTGLLPNTRYYFVCGGVTGGYSGENSFRTAPSQSTSFSFVAGGDTRSGASDGSWPGGRDNVSKQMAKFNPSFVLSLGDFALSGDRDSEWDNWFNATQMYYVDNDNLTIPIIPCIGNHEYYDDFSPPSGGNGISYYGQFSLPGNEQWYSLNWGPNLHITVLSSENSISGAQRDWLQQDLAAHANYLWKIVIFHRPAYSEDFKDTAITRYWAPLFDQYHVDLVFNGHYHEYERTYPIRENQVQSSPENGTVYVIHGDWGAPRYSPVLGKYSAYVAYGFGFGVVDIFDNGTLQLKAVDTSGNVFDNLTITKTVNSTSKPKVSISPSSQYGFPGGILSYTVTVNNTGNVPDNYNLTASDNAVPSWTPSVLPTSLTVPAGENRTATLSVTVPSNAIVGTIDNITVTANGAGGIDNASCTANALNPFRVGVSISPNSQVGENGATLTYTVTVNNTGNVSDNYSLAVSDNAGPTWSPSLSNHVVVNLAPGASDNENLIVTIPSNVIVGTIDNITVTATSNTDNTVSGSDSCTAQAVTLAWEGTATFKFENLYKVSLEKDLWLYTGSKLVVKFYKYDNTFENQSVIHENFALPWNVIPENENVAHPSGIAIKRATLVLTTDDTDNVISEIASFTVHPSDLRARYMDILRAWAGQPEQQSAFRAEVMDILRQWSGAPP